MTPQAHRRPFAHRSPSPFLTAFLVAAALATPERARADEPLIDYHVKKGDTCAAIATRFYGDAKYIDLIHEHNEMGPPPHSLKEGQVLRIPPSLPPGTVVPDARVSFVRNEVEAFTPTEHPARKQDPLMRGHRVSTLEASSAEVTFTDQSRLQLGEHTLVVILGALSEAATAGNPAATGRDTTLLTGSLRAHLSELSGAKPLAATKIATSGGAHVACGAGESQISVDEKKTTRLAVYKGRSRLRSVGKEQTVPDGFGSKAESGKPPTTPRPLPAAPVWITPPPGLVLSTGTPVDVSSTYGKDPQASGKIEPAAIYHLQLARDSEFNDLLVDTRVPTSVDRLEAKGLEAGEYHARVSAIDADFFEGKFSPIAMVRVATLKIVPPSVGKPGEIEVPAGMTCSLDMGDAAAAGQKLMFTADVTHKLLCAVVDAPQSITPLVAELELPAQPAAPAAPPSAPVADVVKPAEAAPAPLPLDASAPVVAPPPKSSRQRVRALLGVGFALQLGSPGIALGAILEAGLLAPLPKEWWIGVAVRGGYDGFAFGPQRIASCVGEVPLPSPCAATHMNSYEYEAFEHVGTLDLPITFGVSPLSTRLSAYLGIAPGAAFDVEHVTSAGAFVKSQLHPIFHFDAYLGGAVRVGPGGFYLEAGYRFAQPQFRDEGDVSLTGFRATFGYRFSL